MKKNNENNFFDLNNHNENYYTDLSNQYETIKQDLENCKIDDFDAYLSLKDLNKEIFYFIFNHEDSTIEPQLRTLYSEILNYMNIIKNERKTVYILKTNENKMIAISKKSLIQKCIARLSKDAQVETYNSPYNSAVAMAA